MKERERIKECVSALNKDLGILSDEYAAWIKGRDEKWAMKMGICSAIEGIELKAFADMMEKAENEMVARTEFSVLETNHFRQTDKLVKEVEEANAKVKVTVNDCREIQHLFENEIKVSWEKERKAYEGQLQGKDQFIKMMKQEMDDMKKELQKVDARLQEEKQRSDQLDQDYKEYLRDMKRKANKGTSSPSSNGEHRRRSRRDPEEEELRRKRREFKKFHSEVMLSDKYNKEQKSFLLESMKSGISYDAMKKYFGSPKVSVELMKMLRDYYEDNFME